MSPGTGHRDGQAPGRPRTSSTTRPTGAWSSRPRAAGRAVGADPAPPHRRALPRRPCSATPGTRPIASRPTFEHELPQEVEDRLFVALDRPATCPHGFPIPEPETGEHPRDARRSTRSSPATSPWSRCSGSTDPEIVAFLDTLGLRPGVERRGQGEAPVRRPPRRCGSTDTIAPLGSTVAEPGLRSEVSRQRITARSPVDRSPRHT